MLSVTLTPCTGDANIKFSFPEKVGGEEMAAVQFDWAPVTMASGNEPRRDYGPTTPTGAVTSGGTAPAKRPSNSRTNYSESAANETSVAEQLLMFALPHQQVCIDFLILPFLASFLEIGGISRIPRIPRGSQRRMRVHFAWNGLSNGFKPVEHDRNCSRRAL
jgi:hypothetical protein